MQLSPRFRSFGRGTCFLRARVDVGCIITWECDDCGELVTGTMGSERLMGSRGQPTLALISSVSDYQVCDCP